ncbi:MAG TPA: hypothetical protein VJN95_16050 [Gemmatimonadales bacterium]|nr:hypothetical protein [Gemmatimonadales bacterium]
MATPPPRDHRITIDEGAAHTRRFREVNPGTKTPKAGMFWRSGGLDELMAQKGCAGLRVYFGRDTAGAGHLVLVAVDAQGDDLSTGTVLEQELPCPPFCSTTGPLAG